MALDLDHVRAQFPSLSHDWVLFDNAGGSQTLSRVVDRIGEFLLTSNVQLGASYDVSVKASERVAWARGEIARLVNAASPDEIVMGHSTTVLLQFLARAMAHQLREGDEIIVTHFDHESNIGPWMGLEKLGVHIKFWRLDLESLECDLADLERLMTDRTKLVCVTHVSNILGTINPIAEIARLTHERGAKICVDAVAYAPHRAIDVRAWDVDYYAFSLYKTYGPHHAILYGKHELLLELDNLYHYFYPLDKVPAKLEPGNVNYELCYGSTGVVHYLEEIGARAGVAENARARIERAFTEIEAHENSLGERLLSYLRARNDCRVIGRTRGDDERVPTISFVINGRDSETIVRAVDPHRIGIRFGDFHARRLVDDLGLSSQNGVVRVSMVHYNTLEEVERLIEVLDSVL